MSRLIGSKRFALMFVVAAAACLAGPALADQTHFNYSVPAGGHTALIPIPAQNTPVLVSCTQNLVGNVGEGQATIIRSSTDVLLDWVGFDYFTDTVSHGFTSTNGTHIIWCDFSGQVDIQVGNAISIQVGNKSSSTQAGVIMFNY